MIINKVEFKNFRNLKDLYFEPHSRMNVIYGENGQGKTNILEGLWLFLKTVNPMLSTDIETRVINIFHSTGPDFFNTAMSTISDAFVTWRYIYESHGATIQINFLRIFREVVREVCCETLYHMTWDEYTKGAEQCQN